MKDEILAPVALLQDGPAGDVGRQQIRRELMRRKSSASSRDSALISSVLPSPGRPSRAARGRAREERGDDLVDRLSLCRG
jgi:hypothetical protein